MTRAVPLQPHESRLLARIDHAISTGQCSHQELLHALGDYLSTLEAADRARRGLVAFLWGYLELAITAN